MLIRFKIDSDSHTLLTSYFLLIQFAFHILCKKVFILKLNNAKTRFVQMLPLVLKPINSFAGLPIGHFRLPCQTFLLDSCQMTFLA